MSGQGKRTPRLFAVAIVVLALVAAACGGGGGTNKTTASDKSQPRRIVSLSATATEMLYAIGAGKQVVAVDDTSNYPAGVPTTKLNALNPNVEAIAAYKPDLVVAAQDTGGLFDNLKRLSVATLLEPAAKNLDESYAQINQLGTATGHTAAASDLVKKMRAKVASLVAEVPKRTKPLTYYHELDNTLFSVTSDTFIGQMYKLAGLQNIADATQDKAGGYPQLSAEFVLQSKPDFIFLADTKCCGQSPATVAARPGWGDLPAVTQHHVVALDDDVASRWGPRVTDLLQVVINATKGT
ncbi:MAG: ABC transporter substrate-binding protein [Acidimicrobiia bacterium]|nr:ABC transporter substrate-binding protein [Acidimicrobiia bacterium]